MEEIRFFAKRFSSFVKQMKTCSYHHSKSRLDLEHLENNVWNHAVISYSKALALKYSKIIRWAVLLHDIGRILTRKIDFKTKTVSFGSYFGVSAFLAYEVLKESNLKKDEILQVVKIISNQNKIINVLKDKETSLDEFFKTFEYDISVFNDLISFSKCDLKGRKIDESLKEKYKSIDERIELLQSKVFSFKEEKKYIKKDKNLYLLVGPPCSGKSTWTKNFKEESHKFCRDEFILEIARKYKVHTYNKAFFLKRTNKNIEQEVNELSFKKQEELVNSSCKNIIIDNVNLSKDYRNYWIEMFKKTHNIHVVLILTPYSLLLKRDIKRYRQTSKSIGKFAMLDNLKHFEYPLLSENIDSLQTILN